MLRRWGPLLAAVAIQVAILVAIPARRLEARLRGTEITLRTVPVDPYDVLAGYYVTLRYEAEPQPAELVTFGNAWLRLRRGEPAWTRAELVLADRAAAEAPGEVVVRLDAGARTRGESCLVPSACRFYIPEARREQVADAMREAGGRALVDLKVDGEGNVALVRLRVGGLVLAN